MTTLRQIYYSFPVRLLVLHWRNHLVLIGLWVFLALLMTGTIGRQFGTHYLMLTPEYRGEVGFWSFAITGAAFGAFFMIWNLTAYLLCADRFPFLATLDAPFTKFCLNNAIIPLGFFATFLAASVWLQWHDELTTTEAIALNISGFIAGMALLVAGLSFYFYLTNHDLIDLNRLGKLVPKDGGKLLAPGQRLATLREIRTGETRWRVDTYLNERLRPRAVRSVAHYDLGILQGVFRQNHLNAVVVQVAAMLLLITLGLFMESEWCRIPTGATVFVLASMVMAAFGAITFWFRQWGTLVFLVVAALVNWFTSMGFFNFRNQAYGLDYQVEKRTEYSYAALEKMCSPDQIARDKAATIAILERWLAKNRTPENPRPKMVFVCVSGGGIRSALWTMHAMQQADSVTAGRFLCQTALISGASGGMLGAGYIRELYLRFTSGEHHSHLAPAALDRISRDLLNPVGFGIVANDLFVPLTTFRWGGHQYRKDRGYLFEYQLDENCQNVLRKPLAAYRAPEMEARIPMFFITPYLLNDARRLVISPQGVSYMMRPQEAENSPLGLEIDAVDFGKLFAEQDADSLAFTSALRMNCTYPYILPNAFLPTRPMLEVMDAGFRDNYGIESAARFLHVFRDWIVENTGGVVVVQVRCWEKIDSVEATDRKGVLSGLFSPVTALGNLTMMQDYEQDNALSLLGDLLGAGQLEVVRFLYRPVKKDREASMNLHLSKLDKLDLHDAFFSPENQASLERLKKLLGG